MGSDGEGGEPRPILKFLDQYEDSDESDEETSGILKTSNDSLRFNDHVKVNGSVQFDDTIRFNNNVASGGKPSVETSGRKTILKNSGSEVSGIFENNCFCFSLECLPPP